jgi:hypothetical protein
MSDGELVGPVGNALDAAREVAARRWRDVPGPVTGRNLPATTSESGVEPGEPTRPKWTATVVGKTVNSGPEVTVNGQSVSPPTASPPNAPRQAPPTPPSSPAQPSRPAQPAPPPKKPKQQQPKQPSQPSKPSKPSKPGVLGAIRARLGNTKRKVQEANIAMAEARMSQPALGRSKTATFGDTGKGHVGYRGYYRR